MYSLSRTSDFVWASDGTGEVNVSNEHVHVDRGDQCRMAP